MCDMLRGSLLFTARAWAVRIVFLIYFLLSMGFISYFRRRNRGVGGMDMMKGKGKEKHTCLPFKLCLLNALKSSSVNGIVSTPSSTLTRSINILNTLFLALVLNSPYRRAMWMRDWKASSKVSTRLVVRKRMPWKYSRSRRKMETRALRWMSWIVRFSRKTSASSRRRTAPQAWAMSRI